MTTSQLSDKLTWPACCVSGHWCIFQGLAATCWCSRLLSNAFLYFESWCIALNQPGHTGSTWKNCIAHVFCFKLSLSGLLGLNWASLTHWLCEPLETQHLQSLIYEWRKYCGCTWGKNIYTFSLFCTEERLIRRQHQLTLVHSWLIGQSSA